MTIFYTTIKDFTRKSISSHLFSLEWISFSERNLMEYDCKLIQKWTRLDMMVTPSQIFKRKYWFILKCIDGKFLIAKYKNNNRNNSVQGSSQLDNLFADIVYMLYNNVKLGCETPHTNWFMDQLFTKNGTVADSINIQGKVSVRFLMLGIYWSKQPKYTSKRFEFDHV